MPENHPPDLNEGIREIRAGRVDYGLSILKKSACEWRSMPSVGTYCIGLMMAGKYDEALSCASEAVRTYNSVTFYSNRGVCYWLKGEYEKSRIAWEDGLDKSQYRDAAGGLELPLLIYATCLIRNDNPTLYRNRLSLAYEDSNKRYWPAHLARFVLGMENINHPKAYIEDLDKRIIEKHPDSEPDTQRRSVLSFYRCIVALENHDLDGFRDGLHSCVSFRQGEFRAEWWIAKDMIDKKIFLHACRHK
jgi:hypothetical protein